MKNIILGLSLLICAVSYAQDSTQDTILLKVVRGNTTINTPTTTGGSSSTANTDNQVLSRVGDSISLTNSPSIFAPIGSGFDPDLDLTSTDATWQFLNSDDVADDNNKAILRLDAASRRLDVNDANLFVTRAGASFFTVNTTTNRFDVNAQIRVGTGGTPSTSRFGIYYNSSTDQTEFTIRKSTNNLGNFFSWGRNTAANDYGFIDTSGNLNLAQGSLTLSELAGTGNRSIGVNDSGEIIEVAGSSGSNSQAANIIYVTSPTYTVSSSDLLNANGIIAYKGSADFTGTLPEIGASGDKIRFSLYNFTDATMTVNTFDGKSYQLFDDDNDVGFTLFDDGVVKYWKPAGNWVEVSDLFPELAGSFSFPTATNFNITSENGVTAFWASGTPNVLRITSDNNSGGDFGSQFITSTNVGETYTFEGELRIVSVTIDVAHAQLREENGNFSKFEADETILNGWQSFSETITIANGGDLVTDFPVDGEVLYRNMKVKKQ